MASTGAGPEPVPQKKLTAANLAAAICQAVEDPAIRQQAGKLGQAIRAEDGVDRSVEVITGTVESFNSR